VGYTAAQAARLSGCTVSQLRYWSRTGLLPPTEAGRDAGGADRREAQPESTSRHGKYSFRDLVALRVVHSLLDAGLSSIRVRAAVRWVRESGDELSDLRLVTDGRNVWACRDDGQILDALRAGQLALFVAVDSLAAEVDAEVRAFDAERAAFVERITDAGAGASEPRG
jgi:DNA-binding transcriptional MerR regulator